MIDTCASEFDSYIPYFYSTYEEENESVVTDKPSVVVLGAGPIRIGQGVEFDYSTVHAIWAIREAGTRPSSSNNKSPKPFPRITRSAISSISSRSPWKT